MKKTTSLLSMLALAALGFSANATEASFTFGNEGSTLLNVSINWDFQTLEEGSMEYTLTLPDGSTQTQVERKAILEYVNLSELGGATPPTIGGGEAGGDNVFIIFNANYGMPFTELGEYVVELPEGTVLIDGEPNSAQTLTFTLVENEEEGGNGEGEEGGEGGEGGESGDVTYMEPGVVEFPASIYSSFPPYVVDINYFQEIALVDPEGEDEFIGEYSTAYVSINGGERIEVMASIFYLPGMEADPEFGFEAVPEEWMLDITLAEAIEALGIDIETVDVIIPAGLVVNPDGEVNPEQTFSFYVLPLYQGEWELTPADGTTLTQDEAVLTLDYDGNQISPLAGVISARTYTPNYIELLIEMGDGVYITNDNKLIVDLTDLIPGNWEIVIPEGFLNVEVDGVAYISPEVWAEYDIEESAPEGPDTGVEGINGENRIHAVYNMMGVKVGDSTNLSTLDKGIYIINGKKVIVRK